MMWDGPYCNPDYYVPLFLILCMVELREVSFVVGYSNGGSDHLSIVCLMYCLGLNLNVLFRTLLFGSSFNPSFICSFFVHPKYSNVIIINMSQKERKTLVV